MVIKGAVNFVGGRNTFCCMLFSMLAGILIPYLHERRQKRHGRSLLHVHIGTGTYHTRVSANQKVTTSVSVLASRAWCQTTRAYRHKQALSFLFSGTGQLVSPGK